MKSTPQESDDDEDIVRKKPKISAKKRVLSDSETSDNDSKNQKRNENLDRSINSTEVSDLDDESEFKRLQAIPSTSRSSLVSKPIRKSSKEEKKEELNKYKEKRKENAAKVRRRIF